MEKEVRNGKREGEGKEKVLNGGCSKVRITQGREGEGSTKGRGIRKRGGSKNEGLSSEGRSKEGSMERTDTLASDKGVKKE